LIQSEMCRQIAETLKTAEKILITTHIKADGDGLGSELALRRALILSGKDARIINDSPASQSLKFMLENEDEVLSFDAARDGDFVLGADLIVVVDVALLYRLGRLQSHFEKSTAKKICVDHHLEGDEIFDLKLAEPCATSTGELIYGVLKEMGAELTPSIAGALYTSIVVDSGCLSYERCVSKTFKIVADLVEKGANPYEVHLELHWQKSLPELKLEGVVISRLKVKGEVAYSYVTSEAARFFEVDPMEMPELVHIPLALSGVEIALLFIENGGREIKVSARSKGRVKVCKLARTFGGGGHSLAAGFVLDGPLESAIEKVVKEAISFLDKS
jgi:bifunctional oligoribonuclease and PAP phosphatase NrnA